MLEPGITDTEQQGHFTFQGATDWIANARKSIDFLKAEDIAHVVGFLVAQPKHVNLQQVVIMSTKEGSAKPQKKRYACARSASEWVAILLYRRAR